MNKNITRRVVLGTVLGGLAACPFVLRALRRSNTDILGQIDGHPGPRLVLPEGGIRQQFFSEWKQMFDRVNITPVEEKGIKTVMLSRKIPEAGTWNFCSLETNIVRGLTPNDDYSSENLLNYTVIEGVLRAAPDSQSFVVSAQKHETVRLEIDVAESRKKGTKIDETLREGKPSSVKIDPVVEYDKSTHSYTTSLVEKRVVQQKSLGEFEFTGDLKIKNLKVVQPKNSDEVDRMLLMVALRSLLYFPFTSGERKVGSVFNLSSDGMLGVQFPSYQVRIGGVSQIRGNRTVELIPLSTDIESFCDFFRKKLSEEMAKESLGDAARKQCESVMQRDLMRLRNTLNTGGVDVSAYVSLSSGLVLFRKLHNANAIQGLDGCTTTSVFCMS